MGVIFDRFFSFLAEMALKSQYATESIKQNISSRFVNSMTTNKCNLIKNLYLTSTLLFQNYLNSRRCV